MGCNESKVSLNEPNQQQNGKAASARNGSAKVAPQQQQPPSQRAGPKSAHGMAHKMSCPASQGHIKLTHFNDGGRCVPLLMLLDYAQKKYESEVVAYVNWATIKPTTDMGSLPIMTIGSEKLVSSLSILKYLGAEAGLEGSTSEEQAAIDEMIYMIEDSRTRDLFYSHFLIMTQNMDEETRLTKQKEYIDGPLAALSKYLDSHITGSTWLLSKLTTADFWLYGTLKVLEESLVPDVCSKMRSNKLQKWKNDFECLPQVAAHLQRSEKEKLKFTYFNVRGRAEPFRMILAYGHVNHDEQQLTREEWGAIKPTTLMGYLPTIQVGDDVITTSLACLNYLGKETGLKGGPEEAACDQMVNILEDSRSVILGARFLIRTKQMDDETKKTKIEEFLANDLPKLSKYMEDHITGDKWLFKQLTVADFWLHGTIESIEDSLVPDVWERMGPKVQQWRTNFESIPQVKAYMDSRPKDYSL